MSEKENSKLRDVPMSEILPQDVMYEILLLLPVKSVGRFRCVSKVWRYLLSKPQFAKLHRNLGGPEDKIIFADYPHRVLSFISETSGVSTVMGFKRFSMVKGSCHGLVLLLQDNSGLVLKNPITLETLQIPNPEEVCYGWNDCYGVGYDSWKDDYKIVLFKTFSGCVRVFSVRNRTWRNLGNSVYTTDSSPGMLLSGRLHWFGRVGGHKNDDVVAAFNSATDEFEEIPYPRGFQCVSQWKQRHQLIVLGGCLAIMCEITSLAYDVWLMKDYGLQDSWTKFTVNPHAKYFIPFCSLGEDGIVLFHKIAYNFATYNRTSGDIRNMVVNGIDNPDYIHKIWSLAVGFSFRESLVSLFFKIN